MKYLDKENDIPLIFIDNHLILVAKPPNMLTQPHNEKLNLQDIVKQWIKKEFLKKGNVFLHPIHRIDKPVSGLVLFARTSKALSRLNEEMRQRKIERIYLAYVEGHLSKKEGQLSHFLIKKEHHSAIVPFQKGAKEALLIYKVIKEEKGCSLVEVSLLTGRYHQIRAQFAYIGHPIVGDEKYGSSIKKNRILLHHATISFVHPITKERMCFSQGIEDFTAAWQ